MYFFTADQHYEHSNIILPNYCDRPFKNIEGMSSFTITYLKKDTRIIGWSNNGIIT